MEISIRRAQVNDAPAFARMMSDPEVFGGLLQLPYPNEEQWRQRLQEGAQPGNGRVDMSLVALRGEELVGSAGLHAASPTLRRRHAATMGISVAAHAQGQGVGGALMQALLDYADNWAQILRMELTVYADNETAIRLYQRHGFVIEGRMPAYALRNGQYVETLAMGRLHPAPPTVR